LKKRDVKLRNALKLPTVGCDSYTFNGDPSFLITPKIFLELQTSQKCPAP